MEEDYEGNIETEKPIQLLNNIHYIYKLLLFNFPVGNNLLSEYLDFCYDRNVS